MANSLSAKKRIRQNEKRRMRNRTRKSAVRTQIKKYLEMTRQSKDIEAVENELRITQKKIDQLAATGVIHKNNAAHKKSQLARHLSDIKARIQ
ncbi:MAG: 30S ribosomal protein S20 [Sedimentisphaerales bacterium]|nr:30S ribosomal protein S20 [Sedimentisphaerales bacterium]